MSRIGTFENFQVPPHREAISLTPPDGRIPPRIFRLVLRSRHFPFRVVRVYVKVPYGGIHGLFALTEALTRAMQTRELWWYRLETPTEITPTIRKSMTRWPEALTSVSSQTGVVFE